MLSHSGDVNLEGLEMGACRAGVIQQESLGTAARGTLPQ